VTDEEASDLTRRLRGIERECHDRQASCAVGGQRCGDYTVHQLELPTVEMEMEIESTLPGEAPARVDLRLQTCTCEDWQSYRVRYPVGGFGRLCRCMSTAFERVLNARPELHEQLGPHLVNLIRLLSTYGLGGIAEAEWRLLEGEGFHHFVSWGSDRWVAVFTENDEGLFERFGFHRDERRWAFGMRPVGEACLAHFIDAIDGE
jgi:hypothetical protein